MLVNDKRHMREGGGSRTQGVRVLCWRLRWVGIGKNKGERESIAEAAGRQVTQDRKRYALEHLGSRKDELG